LLFHILRDFKGGGFTLGKRELTPFGQAVKKRLIELNKTQKWLANEIGISDKYLHLILYGDRSGQTYIDSIMNILDLELDSIVKIA
jgi:hypothetical protein